MKLGEEQLRRAGSVATALIRDTMNHNPSAQASYILAVENLVERIVVDLPEAGDILAPPAPIAETIAETTPAPAETEPAPAETVAPLADPPPVELPAQPAPEVVAQEVTPEAQPVAAAPVAEPVVAEPAPAAEPTPDVGPTPQV